MKEQKPNAFESFIYAFRKEEIADKGANHAFFYKIPEGLVDKIVETAGLRERIQKNLQSAVLGGVGIFVSPTAKSSDTTWNFGQVSCKSLDSFIYIPMELNTGIDNYKLQLCKVKVCIKDQNFTDFAVINVDPRNGTAYISPDDTSHVDPVKVREAFARCGIKYIAEL